jgi:hypothetical protein
LINKTIHDDRLKADVGRWSRIKVREFRRSVRRKDPCAKLLLIRPQQIDSLTALRKMPDERSHTRSALCFLSQACPPKMLVAGGERRRKDQAAIFDDFVVDVATFAIY